MYSKLPSVRIEISNYCNLKCPHCVRSFVDGTYKLNSKHVSLEELKNWMPTSFIFLKTSRNIFLSGAVAEPTLNPDCLEIVKHFSKFCKIILDTNGSTNDINWWKNLGSTEIECIFSPDSLIAKNNKYRINSNTEKVISNIKSFISGGGKATWKYIPFKHNENEIEDQQKISTEIGAKFVIVQPKGFDEDQNIKSSKHFPNSRDLVGNNVKKSSPNNYCKLFGTSDKLIEISPDGIIYPCCFLAKEFFSTYANFFSHNDPSPVIHEHLMNNKRYKSFISDVLPLIEKQGGIKTLSLHHNTITNILQTDFYKFSLINSWKTKNDCCNLYCESREYFYTDT